MYPTLKDKKFTDLSRDSIITVEDQFEDVAILDNGQRIKVDRLLDKSYYDEYIDPVAFFGDTFNVFADKIKSVPAEVLDKIVDDEDFNGSAIIQVDPNEERRILEEKAKSMYNQGIGEKQAQKQIDMLRDIMADDDDLPLIKSSDQSQQNMSDATPGQFALNDTPPIQRINAPSVQSVIDPITTMFKNVKRNKELSFTIDVTESIPRLDFIEMMEDSYETSIINFLADEFTEKIISNPKYIKSKIVEEIKRLVYPDQGKEDTKFEIINDTSAAPMEIINDGSTQVKKSTRKITKKSNNLND